MIAAATESSAPAVKFNRLGHRREAKELTEVKEMQHIAYRKALDQMLPDKEQRAWAKTYAELSERRRILQNKPLPGSLRPEQTQRKARTAQHASLMAEYAATHASEAEQPDVSVAGEQGQPSGDAS